MILVDTNVWIDHQRGSAPHLTELLEEDLVAVHPAVIGELACSSLADRRNFLDLLRTLTLVSQVGDEELLYFIDTQRIFARGVGYVEMHLLAASVIGGVRFWTRDRRLFQIALDLEIAYTPQA